MGGGYRHGDTAPYMHITSFSDMGTSTRPMKAYSDMDRADLGPPVQPSAEDPISAKRIHRNDPTVATAPRRDIPSLHNPAGPFCTLSKLLVRGLLWGFILMLDPV